MTTRYCIYSALFLAACLMGVSAAQAIDTTTLGTNHTPSVPTDPTRTPPVLVISFPDRIQMHNMGIASDGTHYYTCNGGNAGAGQINTYDLNGNLQHTTPCLVDMRAIFYNPIDGFLYAKSYDMNLYRVDPVNGGFTIFHAGMFAFSQSSPALTPDGHTILEQENGTIRFYDFAGGNLIDTKTGFFTGSYPSSEAVGTDGNRIFTWDGTQVHVTDMNGNPIESYNLPSGHFGFSLKFVNGMLFSSDDGAGQVGTWYGYDVGGAVPVQESTWGAVKNLYH